MRGQSEHRRQDARIGVLCLCLFALMLAASPRANAMRFDLGRSLTGSFRLNMSVGLALRTESRNPNFIGKLNLPGQYNFCKTDCSDVSGNAGYLALTGVPNVNFDNGDLNYDRGQLIAGVLRMVPKLDVNYHGFGLHLSAYAFYDPVNYDRDNRHPNNDSNDGFQPARTPRSHVVNRNIGADIRLKNAYIDHKFYIGDYQIAAKVGWQVLSWGKALTLILNSISTINPPDATILTMPGSGGGDFLVTEPLIDLYTDLTPTISLEAFYQLGWRGSRLPPDGGYFSSNDVITVGGNYAMAGFGMYREDPNDQVGVKGRVQGTIGSLSRSGRTIDRVADNTPRSSGQYGIKVGYFATWLNNTSFGFYFHNLHSRLPFLSFVAAKAGCLTGTTNAVGVLLACQGFANAPLIGKEPIPFDTSRYFRDYPEDIHTVGVSFSTNLGRVAWAGEIAYRPNQPLQIAPVDLGFAAIQPFLPDKSISLVVADIPGKRVAAPDYVETRYRHHTVKPRQVIPGYERFKTVQYETSFLLFKGRSNFIGADSIKMVLELGAYQVIDMPSLDELQLASPGAFFHHSAGVDGTGVPNAQQASSPRKGRLNPHYQASGFATRWSYGYRLLMSADYEHLLAGIAVKPQLAFFHDVHGIAPLPTGQFIEGRKKLQLGAKLVLSNHMTTHFMYTFIWGGGTQNRMSDRDYLAWSLNYSF